jgi:tRNA G46 methylase TrmB
MKIIKFLSIFKPRNIYKIITLLYSFTNDIPGRTSELNRIIEENDYNSFLEVGVWRGENLIPIAEKFPKVKCYGVDPYSGSSFDNYYKGEIMALVDANYYDSLYQEINNKTTKLRNVDIIRASSTEAALNFDDESLDVVFIDARHDYQSCKNDILTWLPKVKQGGYCLVMTTL